MMHDKGCVCSLQRLLLLVNRALTNALGLLENASLGRIHQTRLYETPGRVQPPRARASNYEVIAREGTVLSVC